MLPFAYAYDVHTTQHDPTSESAWTIATPKPAFSALDPPSYHPTSSPRSSLLSLSLLIDWEEHQHQLVEMTLIPSYHRSLAFPLYPSWTLAESCQKAEHSTLPRRKCGSSVPRDAFRRLQGTQTSFVLPSAKCRLCPISPHFGRLASDFCVASAISNFARHRCFRVLSRLDLFSEPKFRISSQVTELNNKLVKSYDRVSNLEDDCHVTGSLLSELVS
ncbi:hypothetical protein BGW80DRAFT_923982 [Lactifluus volemus]|nr:hypothetical protein BGW80DRAFT_923982 [Lactifluus volemus]